jgi:hypothetical protein
MTQDERLTAASPRQLWAAISQIKTLVSHLTTWTHESHRHSIDTGFLLFNPYRKITTDYLAELQETHDNILLELAHRGDWDCITEFYDDENATRAEDIISQLYEHEAPRDLPF